MKILHFLWLVVLLLPACNPAGQSGQEKSLTLSAAVDSTDQTHDFYDNVHAFSLNGTTVVEISGEVAGILQVDLSDLPRRSVIVKETDIEEGKVVFVGAYRYDGVSLYDILNRVQVHKKNLEEFKPIIDQYVVVYGASGDSVVFSWGEIYYPVIPHQIIIADRVLRIVPSKTKDQWPLPEKTKVVAGADLVTGRNIEEPVRIVVRTVGIQYKVDRTVKFWAPEMLLKGIGDQEVTLTNLPAGLNPQDLDLVFYGRGMGIHGITTFKGAWLKDLFTDKLPLTKERIKTGLFVIAAVDGYRCAMTYSELMNRNDNAGVLVMDENNYEDAGKFSCLFGADFFSDRAIKSMTEIRLVH
ncbi:MAG: hypothetical protein A2X22_14235 [Bacteroidetes bacterium GWF2_49_14]|nr:MAG: hypothetical protein A2X22_14235 [Bacteroidetes bacterium GWF2_49_14]HBB91696.1 hypothetical protein [Bacteroidales bacterium]